MPQQQWGLTRRGVLQRVTAGVVGLALGPALAACAGTPPATVKLTKKPVTLTWNTYGGATNPFAQAAAQGVKAFQQKFPNITVHPQPDVGTEKQLTEMIAGAAPDIVSACCTTGPGWARKGLLVKLDPYIALDFTKAQLDDFDQNQYRFLSVPSLGQFALPMYMGILALYYNKDRFHAAGLPFPGDNWDWNAFTEAMTKLTNPGQQQWGDLLWWNWSFYVNQNGGHVVDPKDDLHCVIDSPQALDELQVLHDAMWKTNVAMQPGQALKGQTWYEELLGGRRATVYGSTFQLMQGGKTGGADIPLLLSHNWDVAVIPKGPTKRASLATTDFWAIWKGSPHVAEAWELVKWLQSDQWWTISIPLTAQHPSRKSLQNQWVQMLKKDNPGFQDKHLEAFEAPMKQAYAHTLELFKYDDQARPVLNKAYNEAVLLNKTGVSDAFKAAAAQINQLERQLNSGGTISSSSAKG